MNKKKRNLLLAAVVCLLIALCIGIVSCTGGEGSAEPSASEDAAKPSAASGEKIEYTLVLKSEGGKPLEDVGVFFYTDSTMAELVWFAKTDTEGKAGFTDVASSDYVAVLDSVPEGYKVDEYYPLTDVVTEIILSTDMSDGDLANITYKLGDVMLNFSVTAPDGTVYVLSELLEEKEAVVLNFWYLQCGPCRSEFPYLQEAYEKYSEKIEVLALNPINNDNEAIAAFAQELGLTFPMAYCDPAWEKAMELTAYPTTVVIDRYGTIALIHKGSVDEAKVFEDAFEFFTAEDYEQTTVKNIEDLEIQEAGSNSENPIEEGGKTSFTVTVQPGQLVYYHLYKLTNVNLSIDNQYAYVIYDDNTHYSSGGSLSFKVTCPDMFTPAKVVFGNSGTTTQTYTVKLTADAGTNDNPIQLSLGDFSVKSKAGNNQGVIHTYTPKQDGRLTVQCTSVNPAGIKYKIELNTETKSGGTVQENIETNKTGEAGTVSISVRKGVKVRINIGAMPDDSNSIPAATFKCKLSIGEDTGDGDNAKKQITYAVTVTDENRKPMADVTVSLQVDGQPVGKKTDKDGVAAFKQIAATYDVAVTVPSGYEASTSKFQLTEAQPYVSLKLTKKVVVLQDYKITVTDANGVPMAGVQILLGGETYVTNDVGVLELKSIPKDSYRAYVTAPDGYSADSAGYPFEEDSTELTVILEEGSSEDSPGENKVEYVITVVDYGGNAQSGITVQILKDGVPVTTPLTTDSAGKAQVSLEPGNYTVALTKVHYDSDKAILPEGTTSLTIKVASGVQEDKYEMIYDLYLSYYIDVGATYVDLETDIDNYFIFTTKEQGQYKFTTSNPSAKLSYWGNSTSFLFDSTKSLENYDPDANTFTLNVKQKNIPDTDRGYTAIIGIKGAPNCIIEVTRIGDAILDETDIESEIYQAKTTPTQQKITAAVGKKLEYVDLTGDCQIVMGSDGYYHLNSADGPLLYMNLGTAKVTPPYISMYSMLGASGVGGTKFSKTFRDASGCVTKKEDYTECMLSYVNCADQTYGVYPLNEDLVYMMRNGGEHQGWWNPDNANFLFEDEDGNLKPAGINLDIAWMFAVCYVPE